MTLLDCFPILSFNLQVYFMLKIAYHVKWQPFQITVMIMIKCMIHVKQFYYMSCGIVDLKMLGNKVVPFVARTCTCK